MSNKNKNGYKKAEQPVKKNKTYGNPVNTIWGKIIIFILAFAMCFGGLFTLIYYLVTM